jgi:hypothetical protein
VEFRIKAGTGSQPWNQETAPVTATVGDILRLFNDDAQPHRLHTGGTPFPHPATDIQPGQSADFTLVSPHDPAIAGPLFDHTTGQQARFFIVVKPAL